MTVCMPRRRPGRVLLRYLAIALASTATLALPSLAAPSVAAAAAPALTGHWAFDEGAGTTAADSSGNNNPLTLANGAGWGAGIVGAHSLAVSTPSQQYAQSAGAVVDTTQSFTVSAWVYLTSTSGYQTFVSQDGTQISGFFLQLRGDTGRFAFTRPSYDSPKALGIVASAPNIIPQPNEWYHLAGVYDAAQQTISLYVNGVLQQTQPYVENWGAAGSLAVGRGFFSSGKVDFVSGDIDDVQTDSGALGASAISQLAGPGRLTVDASQHGPAINSTQFGEFLEEINHSADGGLYDELIRNADLKESSSSPVAWSEVGAPGTDASVSLDSSQPLNSANPVSLKLDVGNGTSNGRVGVANAGYWGIPVKPSTAYKVSFFARSNAASPGPLTVDLESNSGHVWASATVTGVTESWQQFTTTLNTNGAAPSSLENRFVISTPAASAAGSDLWVTIASLFPPTYDNTTNGLRIDLMQELAALHPGYMRVPGGNYLEGDTIDTRFNWEDTIGPLQDRPGHFNSAWGYWSQDGMGLLEYLELAEELHASPVLAVWAGYTLTGTVVPQSQLQPYVQSALDEIQYATGPTTTPFGAMRAADGHPAPFDVKMIEIGNEDFFDTSGSYNAYRYPMFANAIRQADPQLKLIATTPVTNGPVDIVDEHYYSNDPSFFAEDAHLFDSVSRTGPKVIVGEFATTNGSPTGTLANAVGEAAFLTGVERNADLVLGASYAPLLVNVNAPSWPTNLIGYNALKSFVSPSYWSQEMLSTQHGDHVIGSQLVSGSGTLFDVASQGNGHTYLAVVNDGSAPAQTSVSLAGLGAGAGGGTATTLTGDPDAVNSLAHPNAVAPTTRRLGAVGTSFTYRFPANSVTVLNLTTGAASATSAMRRTVRQAKFHFTFSPAAPKLRPNTKRERHWRQARS
ncbi:MAG TPA: alpha-L-arabinofuranosidase C-terminal domain-containing protein [Solirubrobacteraceae bacterium]